MENIINVRPDDNGRIIVRLYNTKTDVTELIKNGKAIVNLYGKNYKIVVDSRKDSNGISKGRRPAKAGK